MRKLIEVERKHIVECDNPTCDWVMDWDPHLESLMGYLVDMPCPKCKQNVLTKEDYDQHTRLMKGVRFINKWFSWITWFLPKDAKQHVSEVHVHKGIHITNVKEENEKDKTS